MQPESLIAIEEFCTNHGIEISFISSLQQNGLIKITTIKESGFIDAEELDAKNRYETIRKLIGEME